MRNYKRKTDRQHWDERAMENAIEACISGKYGYLKAAKQYNVPRSTLRDRVKAAVKTGRTPKQAAEKRLGRYKTVFSKEQEDELVTRILELEKKLFGLTTSELRKLAYQMAERNGVSHNFNHVTQEAGKDWLTGFFRRHPELSLRTPEATSAARAMGFNRISVQKFFDCLNNVYDRYRFSPGRIYNCDETGISTVAKTQSKVIARKGRRQVGTASSAERGQLVTAEICFSAAGAYIPPLLIFPRQRMKPELLDGAPPGTIAACHPSGWMQSEIFVQWLQHFISCTKPTAEDPVLLILDGHATHVKNLGAIYLARENHVIMVCLPPHTSHKMQPLDVGFMAPLSGYYSQEIKTWLRSNPGRVVTQFQIARLFGAAYAKAATLETAMHSFSKTGIWPLNENIFTDLDFAPADVSERPNDQRDNDQKENSPLEENHQSFTQNTVSDSDDDVPHVTADTSHSPREPLPSCSFSVQLDSVCPVPHGTRKETKRKRGKAAILTSTPYKDELEETQNSKVKQVKKKLSFGRATQEKNIPSSDDEETNEDDPLCGCCKKAFSKSKANEGWVQCRQCKRWFHESCTRCSEEDLDLFVCTKCE